MHVGQGRRVRRGALGRGSEILVGKTELSYTYTQPVRDGPAVQLYHGTLEARPVTADHVEARLHADVRQLDAGRRCGA